MRTSLILIPIFFLFACSQSNPEEMKVKLQGYWEIEKVELPDGSTREFRPGAGIDYFEVSGDSGVRKKVSPTLDGRFEVNRSAERFYLKIEADSLKIYYETPYNRWAETILKAGDSSLVIINQDNKRYHYRKFRSFELKQ